MPGAEFSQFDFSLPGKRAVKTFQLFVKDTFVSTKNWLNISLFVMYLYSRKPQHYSNYTSVNTE